MSEGTPQSLPAESRPGAIDWFLIGRVFLKAALLFALLNALFAACHPLERWGGLSLYNSAFPGRLRLPYGEVPAEDFNVTISNLAAMLASHQLNRPPAGDEFRVLLIGDSATWGWFLENEDTLAGQLNALELRAADGRRVVVHNLGYPVMSLAKDLFLLDATLERTDADLILWPITLQSFARSRQLEHPLLHENAGRVRALIDRYDLVLDPSDPRFVDRSFLQETLVGRRRDVAGWLRLQTYGLAWAATGHDQSIPDEIPLRQTDLEADERWLDVTGPRELTAGDLAFDVLAAGVARAGDVPVVIINEPMYLSDGANSNIRYNSFYPRWAYDQYRELLAGLAAAEGWNYLDLWDAIPPEEFTDTPVHLTPAGNRQLARLIADFIAQQ